ncbi:3-deoxy-7-phosphoheptulonate synthase [Streptomyces cacaoi]|uniref:3-deoxy-7-phosphoheptulonate synthase n=1 Tax=Streptomyces cacaoi TaxID=1898 RepID=UPI00374973AD
MATLTGEDVTECVGGAAGPGLDGLHRRYASARDPRLDKDRALAPALLAAELFGAEPTPSLRTLP